MTFKLSEAVEILERTPRTLQAMLSGLSDGWLNRNEGEGTWNALEVVLHLIEAERTNWIPRLTFLLGEEAGTPFPPFDRFANLDNPEQRTSERIVNEFADSRARSLMKLKEMLTDENLLERKGVHPEFGPVRASELIATWAVHDLTHTAQITRVLAVRYRSDVGPWIAYLSILKSKS